MSVQQPSSELALTTRPRTQRDSYRMKLIAPYINKEQMAPNMAQSAIALGRQSTNFRCTASPHAPEEKGPERQPSAAGRHAGVVDHVLGRRLVSPQKKSEHLIAVFCPLSVEV